MYMHCDVLVNIFNTNICIFIPNMIIKSAAAKWSIKQWVQFNLMACKVVKFAFL